MHRSFAPVTIMTYCVRKVTLPTFCAMLTERPHLDKERNPRVQL